MFVEEYFSRSEVRQRLLDTYKTDLAKVKSMMTEFYTGKSAADPLFYHRVVELQNALIEKVGSDNSQFKPLDVPLIQELMASIETTAMINSLK